jgi:hypothetical protein
VDDEVFWPTPTDQSVPVVESAAERSQQRESAGKQPARVDRLPRDERKGRAGGVADAFDVRQCPVARLAERVNDSVHQISVGPVQGEEVDVKQRGSVQHIASRVTGRLAERTEGPWPALAAVFPAVTASGVPKSAAYDLIRRHEPEPRGLYSGAVLMVSSEGDLDAALVLRTVYRSRGRTWLRAGAGIVGESRPEREFEETCEKLRSVSRHLVPAHDSATAECQAKVSSSG